MLTDQTGPVPAPAATHCPGCWSPAAPGTPFCPAFGLWLASPQAAELHRIEAELQRVDTARIWLISRRAALLDELMAYKRGAEPDPAVPAAPRPAAPPTAVRTTTKDGPRPRPEISGRHAARLLLAAGAALLVISATIFTIAGWSRLGDLGRAGILAAITGLTLTAAPALRRRGLGTTAETVAGLGLVLTLADGYLVLRAIALAWADGGLYAAAAGTGLLAVAWAAYGRVTRLALPRVAAIGAGQFPAVLVAAGLAVGAGRWFPPAGPPGLALILDAAASLWLARRLSRRPDLVGSRAAVVAAITCWLLGVLVAVTTMAGDGLAAASASAAWPARAWVSATMLTAAVTGIAGPRFGPDIARLVRAACLLSGALLALGCAVPLLSVLPAGWALGVVGGCGWAVSAAALTAQHLAQRRVAGEPQAVAASADRGDLVAVGGAATLTLTAVLAVPVALAGLLPAATTAARGWPGAQTAFLVLALTALTCWFAPSRVQSAGRTVVRPAALVAGALAVAAVPLAVPVHGWFAVIALTAGAVGLIAPSVKLSEPSQTSSAVAAGTVLAVGAAARSLVTPDRAVIELAVLTAVFAVSAARSRRPFCAALITSACLASAAGLAWSAAWAAGWPVAQAAYAVLTVAVLAVAASTWLRLHSPVRAGVLDAGAVLIAATSLVSAAGDRATFSLIAVTVALAASAAAWRREGRAKSTALAVSCCAAAAGLIAQADPLAKALLAPARIASHPWRGVATAGTVPSAGLPFAVIVAACGVIALVSAAGAARGRRASAGFLGVVPPGRLSGGFLGVVPPGRLSFDAGAFALAPVAFLVGAACGLTYWPLAGLLLGLTLGLAAWAAAWPDPAPARAALLAAGLSLAWCLAAPLPTVLALSSITAACVFVAQRAKLAATRTAAAGLARPAAGALAVAAVLAVGGTAWQAALAVLDVAVVALGGYPRGSRESRDRRRVGWALLAVLEAGWCVALAAAGTSAPEAYTVPAALVAVVPVLRRTARDVAEAPASSWLTRGPGLALALGPSLAACWLTQCWIRPVALAGAAAAVAVAGGRARLQAPLLAGAAVAMIAALREVAPAVAHLVGVLPGWVPVAVIGAVLLWAGASYEARLRNLRAIRRSLGAMD